MGRGEGQTVGLLLHVLHKLGSWKEGQMGNRESGEYGRDWPIMNCEMEVEGGRSSDSS